MRMLKVLALALLVGSGGMTFAAEAEVQPPTPGPGQFGEDSTYVIGPGDTLEIFVWRNPDISTSVTVRPDGKVSTRMVDDLLASGQTPSSLARLIETRIADIIRNPQVNVIVTNAKSEFSKVIVIGEVGSPGSVAFRQGLTVLDVILAVGGLNEFAAGNRSTIQRTGPDGKRKEIPVKLNDLVRKGRLKENVEVRPGDVVVVPPSRF
jgi:polysaccharide export outer membrane protein